MSALVAALAALAVPAAQDPLPLPGGGPAEEAPAGAGAPTFLELPAGLEATVHANFLGRADDSEVLDPESGEPIDDRMRLRRVDLDLGARLAPRADALVVLSLVSDPVNEFEAEVDEGFFALRSWIDPDAVPPPWGFRARAGRLRSAFGYLNELRLFQLPQPTRSLVVERFLGPDGFVQTGISGELRLPTPGPAHALSWTVEGFDNGDVGAAETSGDEAFASTSSLEWTWTSAPGCTLEGDASLYRGKVNGMRDDRVHMASLALVWTRRAAPGAARRGFSAGGELLQAWIERGSAPDDEPMGYTLWSQVEVAPEWTAGARFDAVQALDDEELETDVAGLFLHWAYAPELRFGLGYERIESDDALDGTNSVFFEANFAFGSAPLRPAWPLPLAGTGG
jgi:hypothetical protein